MSSTPSSSPDTVLASPRSTLASRTTNLAIVPPSSPPTSSSSHVPLSSHKENTLTCRSPMALSIPHTLKRRLTESDDPTPTPKKPRPSGPSITLTLKPPKPRPFAFTTIPLPNACEEYPNGFIYCHQCSKKRDVTDAIQCTFLELHYSTKEKDADKPPRQRRCVGKFCKFCLKNRYDLEFDDVVSSARSKKQEPGHVDTAGYTYKCPKCCDSCNCPRCRKSKGLEPMGSAGTIRKPPPEPVPKAPSVSDKNKAKSKAQGAASTSKGKSTAVKKHKAKPLPVVKWSSIPVAISLEDAEIRFNIREFILRFADLLEPSIPKTNLEELEEIGGGRHQGRDDDEGITSWVSEFCVKSIIIGLLNLLAKELHGTLASDIKSAVKEIRNLGVNLNKIWPVLASLRQVSMEPEVTGPSPILPGSSTPFYFTFPDPLPVPVTLDIRAMRSTRNNDNESVYIAYSAQMVPVIASLIEDALLTTAVREEIENGVREGKEAVKDQREAFKCEAERWDYVRKNMETHVKHKPQLLENRAKREYHKHKLISLDNALKMVMPKFAPRLTPAGVDSEDRVYWLLSPGMLERDSAYEFIQACANDEDKQKKGKKKARVPNSEEDRAEMKNWSWLVAVWGKKPEDAMKIEKPIKVTIRKRLPSPPSNEDEDEDEDNDVDMEDAHYHNQNQDQAQEDKYMESIHGVISGDEDNTETERWWGFYEPHEVYKLAEWVALKAGLDDENSANEEQSQNQGNGNLKEEQDSRASTVTPNGSISTITVNGQNQTLNGNGKSRDTSVTVVASSNTLESQAKQQVKHLVDELKTFAELLEWRVKEDKYDLVMKDVMGGLSSTRGSSDKGKGRESSGGSR